MFDGWITKADQVNVGTVLDIGTMLSDFELNLEWEGMARKNW